jgi:putative Holliday junction resolvase
VQTQYLVRQRQANTGTGLARLCLIEFLGDQRQFFRRDAHTGIAISDPTGFLAGYTTVINAYRPEVVIDKIAALVSEYGVEELVLGHPINMDGTRGPRSEKAQAMKALLEERFPIPVVLWDERRTTIDAHQILFNSGKNAKQRKKVVDAVAASLILEGYLTFKKSH